MFNMQLRIKNTKFMIKKQSEIKAILRSEISCLYPPLRDILIYRCAQNKMMFIKKIVILNYDYKSE